MRSFAACLVVALLTSPALAAPAQTPAINLPPIVLVDLPEPCRPVAKEAAAPVLATALGARIRLAGCLADQATAKLVLCDCGESIVQLGEAVTPAVTLLDEVIAAGDPAMQVLGEHAKGELYTSLRVRMLSTIPGDDATVSGRQLRDSRKALLETLLEPWLEVANAAYTHVVELGRANPKLLANPVVRTAIETCKQRLTPRVASAAQPTAP